MNAVFKDLEAQVLALPERERSALAARLLDSLESVSDDSPDAVARAWDEEIARRIADCDAGRTQGIPLEQVQAEIELLLRQHGKA
jgi:putative addiction module component (TIGR02574 family)